MWKTILILISFLFWAIWFIVFQGLVRYKVYKKSYYHRTNEESKEIVENIQFKNWFFFILIGTIWIPILNLVAPNILCSCYLAALSGWEDGYNYEWCLRFQKKENNKFSEIIINFINWCKSGI